MRGGSGRARVRIVAVIALAGVLILSNAQAQDSSSPSPFEEVRAEAEQARDGRPTGAVSPEALDESMTFEQIAIGLMVALLLGLCTHTAAPGVGKFLNSRFNPWASPADVLSAEAREALGMAEFEAALQGAPGASSSAADDTRETARFFAVAPEKTDAIRILFSELSRVPDSATRHKIIGDLRDQIRSFWGLCETPALKPLADLAKALDALVKQAAEKSSRLTPSVLRTSAAAIIQLEKFSRRESSLNWPVGRAPRFLAADDDPISRHAVSAALKKMFNPPDLAENGQAALALAAEHRYDVIFLDVEMPGMDGFEVCSKIHETEVNRKTPVVFVTSHTDFDSRTKSGESGGHDLVGKPFLPFEIALKALTLVIRAGGPRQQSAKKRVKVQTSVSVTATSQAPVASTADQQAALPAGPANQAPGTQVEDFAKTFLANAPASLRSLQGTAASLRTATDHKAQQEPLRKLHGEIHALALQATPAGLHSIAALACALEILLAKLIEKPALRTLPVLESAGTALDLLEEFCSGSQALPVPDASPRILVVDDDPIACRAMCAALQLKFGKPETANSGEAALKLASEKVYDLIFLDVRMPGMDGFTACSKIRVTSTNGGTPIVFVTTLTDTEAQDQCTLSGGDAYIAKPVFPAQIALAATTFSLRGKLNQFKASAVAAVP